MTRRKEPPRDEFEARLRALEAETLRPPPTDWKRAPTDLPSRWATPRERREALAEAIGTTDRYIPTEPKEDPS